MLCLQSFLNGRRSAGRRLGVLALGLVLGVGMLAAADGVFEINQASVLAGSVSPGDSPGFPGEINASGSYILTSNLVLPGEVTGIQINVDDVTLDLNGFTILGVNRCTVTTTPECLFDGRGPLGNSGDGNGITGGRQVVVKNGIVRGAGARGIELGPNSRIERLTISDCGDAGIECTQCTVTDSNVQNIGGIGIVILGEGIASRNTVRYTHFAGIYMTTGMAGDNRVYWTGWEGIRVEKGAHIVGNFVEYSGTNGEVAGILALGSGVVKDNISRGRNIRVAGQFLYSGNDAGDIQAEEGAISAGPNMCRLRGGLCP